MSNLMNEKMKALTMTNVDKPIIKVRHEHLLRASEESIYRSECPVCKLGVLLLGRTPNGDLSNIDRCILCAQMFEYVDIQHLIEFKPTSENLKKWEGFKEDAVNYEEVKIYCCIDELGAVIWRLGHDMGHDRIDKKHHAALDQDILYMRKMSKFLYDLTPKFGVVASDSESVSRSYRRWYDWWKKYFTDMEDSEWNLFNQRLTTEGSDLSQYRPEGDWRTIADIKFKKFNFILGET